MKCDNCGKPGMFWLEYILKVNDTKVTLCDACYDRLNKKNEILPMPIEPFTKKMYDKMSRFVGRAETEGEPTCADCGGLLGYHTESELTCEKCDYVSCDYCGNKWLYIYEHDDSDWARVSLDGSGFEDDDYLIPNGMGDVCRTSCYGEVVEQYDGFGKCLTCGMNHPAQPNYLQIDNKEWCEKYNDLGDWTNPTEGILCTTHIEGRDRGVRSCYEKPTLKRGGCVECGKKYCYNCWKLGNWEQGICEMCYRGSEAESFVGRAEDRDESERMTREEAEDLAAKMIKVLTPFVDFIEICGSYRRGREDPGDLDIVIIIKEDYTLPEIVSDLESSGLYTAVNWLGEKKTQIVVDDVKVDIKVSTTEGLGAALLYFTGPSGYNIGMRRAAKSRGMKLNEYGIWDRDTNTYLGGATEEEIYEIMDKTFKPAHKRAESEDYGVRPVWMAETFSADHMYNEYVAEIRSARGEKLWSSPCPDYDYLVKEISHMLKTPYYAIDVFTIGHGRKVHMATIKYGKAESGPLAAKLNESLIFRAESEHLDWPNYEDLVFNDDGDAYFYADGHPFCFTVGDEYSGGTIGDGLWYGVTEDDPDAVGAIPIWAPIGGGSAVDDDADDEALGYLIKMFVKQQRKYLCGQYPKKLKKKWITTKDIINWRNWSHKTYGEYKDSLITSAAESFESETVDWTDADLFVDWLKDENIIFHELTNRTHKGQNYGAFRRWESNDGLLRPTKTLWEESNFHIFEETSPEVMHPDSLYPFALKAEEGLQIMAGELSRFLVEELQKAAWGLDIDWDDTTIIVDLSDEVSEDQIIMLFPDDSEIELSLNNPKIEFLYDVIADTAELDWVVGLKITSVDGNYEF